MADTSTKSVSEFDPVALVSDVQRLREGMTEVKDRLFSMDARQQSNFRWLVGVVVIPLNLAIMGMLARLLGLL